jgi:hypothetical protein
VQSLLAGGALAGLAAIALQGRRSPADGPRRADNPAQHPPPPHRGPLPQSAATLPEAPSAATDSPHGPALSPAQLAGLAAILQQILPKAGDCPGAADVGALAYLQGALADPRTSPDDITAVVDGLAELERLSAQRHRLAVQAVTPAQLQALLRERETDDRGAEWLGVMIVFALEALLGDPAYGGNAGESGWHWLDLRAPEPRPSDRWYKGPHA